MPDNPGVRIPPPLFYAAAVVGGWALNRRIPLPVSTAPSLRAIAWIFVLMWAALGAASIGLFRRRRTSMIPAYLRRRFGDEYEAYRRQVRRWL